LGFCWYNEFSKNHCVSSSILNTKVFPNKSIIQNNNFYEHIWFVFQAEKGDKPSIDAILDNESQKINVNVTDLMGRTALEIAVDNENVEIVEILLQQRGIKIGVD